MHDYSGTAVRICQYKYFVLHERPNCLLFVCCAWPWRWVHRRSPRTVEGHAENINHKGVVNIGTGRFGCIYIGKRFGGVALLVRERIVSEQVDCREKTGIVIGE